jgi:hypothetical protein
VEETGCRGRGCTIMMGDECYSSKLVCSAVQGNVKMSGRCACVLTEMQPMDASI